LLNATFGNAVEMIIAIVALSKNLVRVVQTSMLGSILSNLLFVLGFCFLLGGWGKDKQEFNFTAAQTGASMLSMVVLALMLPAAFYLSAGSTDVVEVSHITAILLLIIYGLYLYFQLYTHKKLYMDAEGDEEFPQLSWVTAMTLLFASTGLVALLSECLVSSLEDVADAWGVSTTFISLVLLPIVGNAAEHVTSVTCAMKNKMNLAIGVALGSSTQIALFVIPLLVILGWCMDVSMTLYFQEFETVALFISVLIVNYLISDGASNWLEGAMLLVTYLIISISFYFLPSTA